MKKFLFLLFFIMFVREVQADTAAITKLTVSPESPMIFKPATIQIDVTNYGKTDIFTIELFIIREGVIKSQSTYSLSLQPNSPLTITPTFNPDDIGGYQVVVKLWDKNEAIQYDSQIVQFTVISDIGPFDLSINVLTRVIKPGQDIPMLLQMINQGEKGEDVKIQTNVFCQQQNSLSSQFYIFLGAKSADQRVTLLPSCFSEYGLRVVSADLIVFNKTLLTSANQIFLNVSNYTLAVQDFPENLDLTTNKPKVIDVFVDNPTNYSIHNLRLVFNNIPFSWFQVSPSVRSELKANEVGVFLVNFTIPSDINQSGDYPTKLIAAADEALDLKDSTLRITYVAPSTPFISIPFNFPSICLPSLTFFDPTIIIIIILSVLCLAIFIRRKRRREEEYEELKEKWHKIRRTLGE